MGIPIFTGVLGFVFILAGFLVPPAALIETLRTVPSELRDQLLFGAMLFKVGLGLMGVYALILVTTCVWKTNGHKSSVRPQPSDRKVLFVLAIVLLVASVLRVYGLNSGLWLDEILTHVLYATKPFGETLSTYSSQNQHPLYSLLAHASFLAFGEGVGTLRLPAALFGIGSIWALYLFGKQVASAREALLAAALLSVSYHHIWFSQNARGYTGLLFWTLLASWLLLRGLDEGRSSLWVSYAVAASLGVYTHMTMLFVIAGHFIIYLQALFARRNDVWPNRWEGAFLGFCLAALLTFQLHALSLPQFFGGTLAEESLIPGWTNPLWTLLEFVRGMEISFAGSVVGLLALLVFGAGVVSFAVKNVAVVELFFIPVALCAAVVIGMGHHLWPRLFFFGVGFGALIVIRGVMELSASTTRLLGLAPTRSLRMGTVLAAGLICVSAISVPSVYGSKQDYQGALTFVEAKREPGDTIVIVGLATFPYQRFYNVDWQSVETMEDLNAIRVRANRTWLVYTIPSHVESVHPAIMESIRRDFRVVKKFPGTLRGGTVFVCLSDTAPSSPATADYLRGHVQSL